MHTKYLGALIGLVIIMALALAFLNGTGFGVGVFTETADTEVFSGSLAELAVRGGAWRCTFSDISETVTLRGTVYVHGEQIRGDFKSDTEGITIDSHMIADGAFIYTWSPIAPTGYKVPYAPEVENGSAMFRQSYDFRCAPWTVTEPLFAIPLDTEFVEITQ